MELPGQTGCVGSSQHWQSSADCWGSVWTRAFQTPATPVEAHAWGHLPMSCVRKAGPHFFPVPVTNNTKSSPCRLQPSRGLHLWLFRPGDWRLPGHIRLKWRPYLHSFVSQRLSDYRR